MFKHTLCVAPCKSAVTTCGETEKYDNQAI